MRINGKVEIAEKIIYTGGNAERNTSRSYCHKSTSCLFGVKCRSCSLAAAALWPRLFRNKITSGKTSAVVSLQNVKNYSKKCSIFYFFLKVVDQLV